MQYELELQTVTSGYDRETCWVQVRAGMIPPNQAVLTAQKLRLSGSDIFYAIHRTHSADQGRTWSPLVEQSVFAARPAEFDESYFYVSDFWPKWHAASQTLLGTGHAPLYCRDELVRTPYPRSPTYSIYNEKMQAWQSWRFMDLPEDPFYNSGAGCAQRLDLPNGEILLPIYFKPPECKTPRWNGCTSVAVLRCTFDGETLRCLEAGDALSVPEPRGLGEPSLATFAGRYFLTLRNDVRGYVATSNDGLNYSPPQPWTFDDGEEIGNYNTQQHWVPHSDALFLVYTRRNADNDHVFRHRAPLFMAQVDPDRVCLIRETERIVVPERGARLGNFGVTTCSPDESWVVVSEWMQTTAPDPMDCRQCEKYGSDNSIFIARIRWHQPNQLAP